MLDPNKATSNEAMRTEKDLLGEGPVPAAALYGIHTQRAIENFPLSHKRTPEALVRAFGFVKLAAARTNYVLGFWQNDIPKAEAIKAACLEMGRGLLNEHVVVDALQGGAGTSTNMNVNEVLANRALQLCGEKLGNYARISPIEDINLHQSTNDAYPTALKLALIEELMKLEASLGALADAFEAKAKEFAKILKLGRTQLQDAVPMPLGSELGVYAEAFRRDIARLKALHVNLSIVNLGGTAIGTGIAAPREYILRAVDVLSEVSGHSFHRAKDMIDNTQNADVFVEVSGALKACAATFLKCSMDLRLLSSGPESGLGEIILPARQAGSSIMPGKVNPVIPECASQAAMRVIGHDAEVTYAAACGNLELNAFLPLVADALLDGISLLTNAATILREKCVDGVKANEARCKMHVEGSTALVTSLLPGIGYAASVDVAKKAKAEGKSIRQVVLEQGVLTEEQFEALTSPEACLFSE